MTQAQDAFNAAAELGLPTFDKKYVDVVIRGIKETTDNPSAAGNNTEVQFNDNGVLAGDANFTFDKTTTALSGGAFVPTGNTAPTNGLYLPSANNVAISTDGTGKLFIDSAGKVTVKGAGTAAFVVEGTAPDNSLFIEGSTGNVGVGTSSPWRKLQVLESTNNTEVARFTNSGGTSGSVPGIGYIGLDVFSLANPGAYIGWSQAGPSGYQTELLFGTRNNADVFPTERVRIDRSGNVGIGTTEPGARLNVNPGTITANQSVEVFRIDVPGESISSSATGYIGFRGFDVSNGTQRDVAYIGAQLAPDGSNTPRFGGHLVFGTCPTGASQTPTERARIDSSGRLLVGTSSSTEQFTNISAKLKAKETNAALVTQVYGNSSSQGRAQKNTIVRHYPVVSLGTKLIIPFVSQGNLNSTTTCKVWGHSGRYNSSQPYAFEITFAVGHTSSLSNLASWGGHGNYASIAVNGMNIEITFTTAYTSGTADGVFVCIEYMTNYAEYSIDIANIAMN